MKRRLSKVVLVSMVLALLICAQPASAQLSITDLGTLGGASQATDINDRGQVVGTSNHAVLWTT
jgi:hypothetical protein